MERFLLGKPAAARRPPAAELIIDTFEDAVAAGFVTVTTLGVVCQCSPAERHAPGWGRRSCEWPAHAKRQRHQQWRRSLIGERPIAAMACAEVKPSAISAEPAVPAVKSSSAAAAAAAAAMEQVFEL